ncbi:5-oxoprolinase subunit PxpA [Ciceribacter thiooxidans]|uniref:5-oxoprolinase subunit PxpA n=1 Tax=Ciceribacter thiooxidans TaxID=1969821 RepID=A0ABV7I8E8_9HYPH|nr:5-oxoprolinase subunit PxpA [Ciceribacter thiooxidans]MDI6836396.1 5-oxoprolinase subunit PxpA [Rhizobiaceae bacterium]
MRAEQGRKVALEVVDINCDLGEAFGRWHVGDTDDAALMGLISSANIAAGFHGGDPNLMDHTVRLAVEHGVGVGAHPGYHDLQGFGRRKINGTARELVNDIVYQVGALREFARRHGTNLQHVKPHGALYMEMAVNPELAQLFVTYMRTVAPNAYVFCMAGSATEKAAIEAGHPVVREFYADRDYDESGSIVFTRDAGRPDPAAIARKVVRACTEGRVTAVTGKDIEVPFESICFHSDTLGALEIVRHMREALIAAGIRIAPISEIVR